MKRLIDAGHLKDRIMTSKNGSWYDLYTMLAIIDSEPMERRVISVGWIAAAVAFIAFVAFLYKFF